MKTGSESNRDEIRAVYLGAFAINAQLDFRQLGSKRSHVPSTHLPPGFTFTNSAQRPAEDSGLHIDEHRIGTGKRDVTDIILDISMQGDISTRFLISPLGVGWVVVETASPYDAKFEKMLSELVALPIQAVARWVPEAFQQLFSGARSEFLLPGGQLLWWHRVLPISNTDEVRADAWGAKTATSQEGLEVTVGDGFTWITDELLFRRQSRESVVNGLLAATDDWFVADTTNKQLRNYVESLEIAMREANYSRIQRLNEDGEALTQQGQFLRLFMDERDRNLVVLEGEVWKCAREAWGLTGELSNLETKISLIHNQATLAASRLQQSRDSFRNGILFAIALLTALQGLLFVMDFAVNPAMTIQHPVRGAISLVLLVLALGVGVDIARRWIVERRSLRTVREGRLRD